MKNIKMTFSAIIPPHVIMPRVLPDLQMDDVVRLRKPHPCGGYEWKVIRLGADIGLECLRCKRHILLTRRILSRRLKAVIPKSGEELSAQ